MRDALDVGGNGVVGVETAGDLGSVTTHWNKVRRGLRSGADGVARAIRFVR